MIDISYEIIIILVVIAMGSVSIYLVIDYITKANELLSTMACEEYVDISTIFPRKL